MNSKLTLIKPLEQQPLCVDLDGTLVKTDTLVEAIMALVRGDVRYLGSMFLWILKGRLHFKMQVFRHVTLDPSRLPYNTQLLDLIKQERHRGRPVVLATACPYIFAEQVATYLNIFSEVLSSNESINLKGEAKAALLVEKFGFQGFDYAGDSSEDLVVWQAANKSIIVNPSRKARVKLKKITTIDQRIETRKKLTKLILKQVRVHQWAKNILVFLPMFLAHKIMDFQAWILAAQGFVAFSFLSSSVYVVNDLLDLDSDRAHPSNKHRPFASGDLPLSWGAVLAPILLMVGLGLSTLVSLEFFLFMLGYLCLTTWYSFQLKEVELADILILASLYSWRVVAGGIATGVQISEWFISFAIFFFLSLALVKRCSELILMDRKRSRNQRRGYYITDLPLLVAFGVASGFLSILVLALYLSSSQVIAHNQVPKVLWGALPVLLYWLSRIWLKAFRGELPSDPLVFALKDKFSYISIIIIAFLWLAARGSLGG